MVRVLIVLAAGLVVPGLCARPAAAGCPPPPARPAVGAGVSASGGILLADGREIRLAGTALAEAGREPLAALVTGKALAVREVGRPDRWGRMPAHIEPIEQDLIARGLGHAARLAPEACLEPLLAAEAKARASGTGVWARPDYVLAATDGAALAARLGRHVIAEGVVASARTYRGRIYLNFARYWKSGLSLSIAGKDWPDFAAGADPATTVGRRVRARGFLEWRAGPQIIVRPGDRIEMVGP